MSKENTEIKMTKEQYLASVKRGSASRWKTQIFEELKKAGKDGIGDIALFDATRPEDTESFTDDQIRNNVASQLSYLRKQAMDIQKDSNRVVYLRSYWDHKEEVPVFISK